MSVRHTANTVEDFELLPPAQHKMQDDALHGSLFASLQSSMSPGSSDGGYSKLGCLSFGIGEFLGSVAIGAESTCCCIQGQVYIGMGSDCPMFDLGCTLYKPELKYRTAVKVLPLKIAAFLPENKPHVVCCNKDVF
mmetsp:Transcript_77427/g.165971  ORF Transcript_77427/g.165971 Transcript_77427/m.165971 type:complete len:136 (-) Transcript_77427:97-504(-)